MDEARKWFFTQGILGVIVVVEAIVIGLIIRWFIKRESWHQERYDTLMERHNITTEKFAGKGLDAGEALKLIAENVRPRRERG
jgi:uncharacterized protein YoaH (UPF0181 family)